MSKRARALAHQRQVLEKSIQRSIEATYELAATLESSRARLCGDETSVPKKDSLKRR